MFNENINLTDQVAMLHREVMEREGIEEVKEGIKEREKEEENEKKVNE